MSPLYLMIIVTIMMIIVSTNWVVVKKINLHRIKNSGINYVHISDIHSKTHYLNGQLNKIVNKLNPSFTLMTGDLINKEKDLPKVLAELNKINGNVYIVLGNHERACSKYLKKVSVNFQRLKEKIESYPNLKLLINEEVTIQKDGISIKIYGFDNSIYGNEVYCTNKEISDYSIVMAHSPNITNVIKNLDMEYDHLLCGHTHGGQIRLFGKEFSSYSAYHRGDLVEGNRIFTITAGLGTARIPIRINTLPEIRQYFL